MKIKIVIIIFAVIVVIGAVFIALEIKKVNDQKEIEIAIEKGKIDFEVKKITDDYDALIKYLDWEGKMKLVLLQSGYTENESQKYIDSCKQESLIKVYGVFPDWYSEYLKTRDSAKRINDRKKNQ